MSVTGVRMQQSPSGVTTTGGDLPINWPHPGGDPREKFPELAARGVFTAHRIHKWVTARHCLCGCGCETQFLHSRPNSGQWSYFTNRCWANLARGVGLIAPSAALYQARRDPKWLAAVRRENDARLCTRKDTEWYINMVLADIEYRGLNYRSWAREKRLSSQFVGMLVRTLREGQRIQKYTAGTILKALGERMPDDIQRRYDAHRQGKGRARRERTRIAS